MSIAVKIPRDLEHRSLTYRLQWWASTYKQVAPENLRLIALFEEAASEIALGQRTELTYRGNAEPGQAVRPGST